MPALSVAIIAGNEEERLPGCLKSVAFCDDVVVVVDSRTTDRTAEVAREAGCRVYIEDWHGSGPQKQSAIDKCENRWVLLLDADERLSPGGQEIIFKAIQNSRVDAFVLNRRSYIGARWVRHSDWCPDWLVRVFIKDKCRVQGKYHPKVTVKGRTAKIKAGIDHFSFRDYSHMISKINRYSDWTSEMLCDSGKKVWGISPAVHGAWMFVRIYFIKRGFLDGLDGLVVAVYSAANSFFKYAKFLERQKYGGATGKHG